MSYPVAATREAWVRYSRLVRDTRTIVANTSVTGPNSNTQAARARRCFASEIGFATSIGLTRFPWRKFLRAAEPRAAAAWVGRDFFGAGHHRLAGQDREAGLL